MPYINEESRQALDVDIDRLSEMVCSKGEMNYAITRLIHNYINKNGKRYDTLNDSIGILQCAQLELYRHIIGPYEDIKIEDNGDIGVIGK